MQLTICLEIVCAKRRLDYMLIASRIKRGLSVLFILGLMMFLNGCQTQETRQMIDVEEYLVDESKGYNGYGTVSFAIDCEKMIKDHLTDTALENEAEDALKRLITQLSYVQSNELKNGDIIEVSWNSDDEAKTLLEKIFNKEIRTEAFSYQVEGLQELIEYNPFDRLQIKTSGSNSGAGTLIFETDSLVIGNEEIVFSITHDGNDGFIANGDVLTLFLEENYDVEYIARNAGMKVSQTQITYTVDCLAAPIPDETIFARITEKTKDCFDKIIVDWVVAGLNDRHPSHNPKRDYEPVGYIYYVTPNDESAKENDGMLFAIYRIYDANVPKKYFTFIGIEGNFTASNEGVYLNQKEFPNSFVYYEKEKVRYDHTSASWREGSEENGFLMYDSIEYAGHMEIQGVIDFVRKYYGFNYQEEFISEGVEVLIQNQ